MCREITPWGLGSTSEGWLVLHFRSGWKVFHIILMSFGWCHVVNSVLHHWCHVVNSVLHHRDEWCFTPTRRVLFYFGLISPVTKGDKTSYMCEQCWTSYGWKIFDTWRDSVCCHSDGQCLQNMDGQWWTMFTEYGWTVFAVIVKDSVSCHSDGQCLLS